MSITVLDTKLFFLMSDQELLHWVEHGDEQEKYAASAEYNFRTMGGLLGKKENPNDGLRN